MKLIQKIIVTVEKLRYLHSDTRQALLRVLNEQKIFKHSISLSKGEKAVFIKRLPIAVSVWAERHRIVHSSSRPGKWHNEVTPYAVDIMNASFFRSVRKISLCKSPQSGGTEAVHNCIGYAIDRASGPVLYVYPDQDTAKENSQDRIQPMISSSNRLSSYLTGVQDDVAAIRIKLAHMTIYLAWSGSASRLGNKPIRYVVMDEVDKYQHIRKEASAVALAEKRVITWKDKARIWKISTPTDINSEITKSLNESEAIFDYYVFCPFCGARQKMTCENIRYPENEELNLIKSRKLAYYECEHCKHSWTDSERDAAVRLGHWYERVSMLEINEHLEKHEPASIGFHLPAWLSTFVSLSDVAFAYLTYKKSEKIEDEIDFFNNYRAEAFIRKYDLRKEDSILALCDDRPRGTVPSLEVNNSEENISCLLAGVDTQKDHFRYVIRAFGYGEDEPSWLVQEGVVQTTSALDDLFWLSEYPDSHGKKYKVSAVIIDAMGIPERTNTVYKWAAKNRGRVFPAQGVHSPSSPIAFAHQEYFAGQKAEKIKIKGGVVLFRIDTTLFKSSLANKLSIAPYDPGAFMLHNNSNGQLDAYAKEMCAEIFNPEKSIWDNAFRKANHAWDCEYLLQALAWYKQVRYIPKPQKDTSTVKYPSPRPKQNIGERLAKLRR